MKGLEVMPDFLLDFPLLHSDFANWNTSGSAVFQRSELILNPDIKNRAGLLYHPRPVESPQWAFEFKVKTTNRARTQRGTDGFAIFYLRDVPSKEARGIHFGYTSTFDGIEVVFDTLPD